MTHNFNATVKSADFSEKSASMPDTIGKYEMINELGRGTCGVVYRGYDPFVQREVAIKIGFNEFGPDSGQQSQIKRDFFAEAHAAGKLQHPNIVALFDAGIQDDYNYLVMEYVEGVTLLEYCQADGERLSTERILDCMIKCCRALHYSHEMKVIHRDIKPSNIMLSSDRETKLMDFSIAEVTQNLIFTPEEVIGSPSYMAPEQILRKDVVPQTDLYSLGAVMYQLFTGERPFMSSNIQEIFKDIVCQDAPLLKDKRKDLPESLSDILERALRKDPAERFEDGMAFADQLHKVYDELSYAGKKVKMREYRDDLKELDFFKDFSDEQVDEMLNASSMRVVPPGEVVIREGDIDDSFYIIVRGEVEIRKSDRLLGSLGKGDCFGEIGFLKSNKRTASVIAVSKLLVFKVNAMLMETVSPESQLRYYKAFNEALIYRLALTNVRLANLSN